MSSKIIAKNYLFVSQILEEVRDERDKNALRESLAEDGKDLTWTDGELRTLHGLLKHAGISITIRWIAGLTNQPRKPDCCFILQEKYEVSVRDVSCTLYSPTSVCAKNTIAFVQNLSKVYKTPFEGGVKWRMYCVEGRDFPATAKKAANLIQSDSKIGPLSSLERPFLVGIVRTRTYNVLVSFITALKDCIAPVIDSNVATDVYFYVFVLVDTAKACFPEEKTCDKNKNTSGTQHS